MPSSNRMGAVMVPMSWLAKPAAHRSNRRGCQELRMDGTALFAGLFGAALGAAICHQLVKREWRAASGLAAIGGGGLLLVVTDQGNRSDVERVIVFVVWMALLLYFVIVTAIAVHDRRQSDSRH